MLTPFGSISYQRHVYQTSCGGPIYCPADRKAGFVGKCTPRLAKLLVSDYCEGAAGQVVASFQEHHEVKVSTDLVRDTSLRISTHVKEIEDRWSYSIPSSVDLAQVRTVSLSRDGAMVHLLDGKQAEPTRKAGYREAMCGVMCLYNDSEQLLHSIYLGVGPQKKKGAFTDLFEAEANALKVQLTAHGGSEPIYIGVADGARDNWTQLDSLTDYQVTDYYHVTERLHTLATVLPLSKAKRSSWVKEQKGVLLDQPNGSAVVLTEAKRMAGTVKTKKRREVAEAQIIYLTNQQVRMNYWEMRKDQLPIGSGSVEAGCKTLIKQRLGGSGMRWLNGHADDMLVVRALKLTPGRYEQYWDKRMRYAA